MFDFIVIGGGIAGLSAGARLAELGSVLLLEAEAALGYHASGRSAAMFEENYGLASTVALTRASRGRLEAAGVLKPRGFLMVGTPATAAEFARDRADLALREIGGDAAREMVPILAPAVDRAAFDDDAWDIDTDRLLQGFARQVRGRGEIRLSAPVERIVRRARGWQVSAAGRVEDGRILVDAAGAWADRVARLAGIEPLGLQPFRRSMARIAAPGGHDLRRWPMVFGPGESWYCKPDAGALIVSPADEDPAEPHDAFADDMVLAEGFARYQAHVSEPVTRPIASWAGLRTFAPDRQLVLGPDPADPAFVWCAGQGGYGFQTSPAASRLIADRIAGRAPEIGTGIAAGLDPARLR